MSLFLDRNSDSQAKPATIEVPKFGHLRQDANPILAAHMLQEMYKLVTGWQQELVQIDRDRVEVVASGTILAGWLESRTFQRNAAGEAIPTPYVTVETIDLAIVDPQAGYRLCGLDEYGQLWTRSCSMAEILNVSQAIARYQQLKDLDARKQQVERHIRQVLEDLVLLRIKIED